MEENEKRRNVELAYLSLMLSGKKVSECELASEVLKISRAKGEKSLAMLVQSSIKITVKVLSVVLEESSKRYSAWVEQAKASKGVSYNAFPKFVAPKCDEDLLEDPAVRDELLARRGYAKEIRNRYASAVPDYGEDNVRAAGQAGTHSVQHPVIESGRTREQSDRNVEH